MIPVRSPLIFLLLSLSAMLASAYQLSIKVTVTEDTLAVGSNVSLVTDGVEIAAGRTGDDGIVKFNVSNGSYFALLKSTLYPLQVSLVRVAGDTSVVLTKRQLISYATAYGQIAGPSDFSDASVAAFRNNLVEKRVSPDENGYYMMSFLPDGAYDMKFEAPGYGTATKREYLSLGGFTEVNAKLEKMRPPPEPATELSAPQIAPLSSLIEVALTKGGAPLAGETIIAETPAGKFELVTDPQGKAAVNAAQSGLYRFTFGALSAMTSVPPGEKENGQPSPAPSPTPSPSPAQPPAPAPAQQEPSQKSAFFAAAALFFLLLFVGLLALLVWMKLVSPALAKAKEEEVNGLREQVKQEHPPAHAKHRKKAHHGKK